jgi:glycosyltransferase involved in cell wall biosynthesis
VTGAGAEPAAPAGLVERLAGAPFLLCLGTTYKHKNRPFALRLLAALRERHGWEGRLVLAGPEVADGSSAAEEAAWELANPAHAAGVVRLGAVGEAERAWLYAHAAAVVYPSTYEGFGLVPFEAAQAGTPCLWAPVASLAEVLAGADAPLVPWDAAASADRAIAILRDPVAAGALTDQVRAAASAFTWDRTAEELLGVYEDAVRLPAREAARLARAEVATQGAYWGLRAGIGDTGMALVGPDDPLLPPDAQRALAALARRDASRRTLLRLLGLAARAGRGGGGS